MREIERKTVKSEKLRKEKSLENVVFSRLLVAEGVGFEPTWAEAQTVFKTSYSRGQFRLLYGGLAHFSSLEILIPQGFLPRFDPFEHKSNQFESNGISKNLSKISHFRENLERT